jgi:hypothetical protein
MSWYINHFPGERGRDIRKIGDFITDIMRDEPTDDSPIQDYVNIANKHMDQFVESFNPYA